MPTGGRRTRRWAAAALSAALATPPIVLTEGSAQAAASPVRLSAAFTSTGRVPVSGGQQRSYAVDVRPQGGVARAAALTLIAQQPLEWRGHSSECTANRNGRRLRCSLGDLARSRRMQVVVFVPGSLRTAQGPRIVAVASAQNLTGTSMMDVRLPKATAGPSYPTGSSSPSSASGSSTASVSPRPGGTGRPSGTDRPSPRPSPSNGTSGPSESSGTASAGSTATPGATGSSSPRKPGVSIPPTRKPLRTPSRRHGRRPHHLGTPGMQAGPPPAYNLAPPLQQQPPPMQLPPVQPPQIQAPPAMPQPAMPQAPAAPPMPDSPGQVPGAAGEPPAQPAPVLPPLTAPGSAGAPSGMVLPTPGAPGASGSSASGTAGAAANDGNQMTLISPTGTDEEGTPWAAVLGIALVGELALLWMVACLGLVRRRFALASAARAAALAEGTDGSRRVPRAFAAVARPFAAVGRRLNPVRPFKAAARKLRSH
ncbi:hypothetical protein J4573_37755 [Actinomadura barringtoniae]|uniref:Uncharacterized protein n=1 Tax=Actinomadura barringtoniae TaxID=1427535 RepID=A0A939T7A2_9ACTN|nr:hypothetical protein [Actinomadura barringtoniae]MBO2452888.1 hypothetical protein [Actinomadura barringtoniae]